MLAYLEAKIGIKYNLLVSIFSNFPGGHAPRPPRRATHAECASHTSGYLRIMLGTPNLNYLPPPMYIAT